MSFDVVASSRVEEVERKPWQHALTVGAGCGAAIVMMATVGIFRMFNSRLIIADVLTLGYATLVLTFMAVGILVARQHLLPKTGSTYAAAAVSGFVAAALASIIPLLIANFSLRQIFVSFDPPLMKFFTFNQPALERGLPLLLLLGIVMAVLGAVLVRLAHPIRKPLVTGLIASGVAGLFQELIRPVLANSSITKPLHDVLYSWTGLTLQGAIVVFLVAASISALNLRYGERLRVGYDALPDAARRTLRRGYLAIAVLFFVLFPLFAGNFVGQVLLMVALFTLMGMGLNIEVGLAGLLDLGFVAFFAVGAYVTALLTADDQAALASLTWWQAMPIAVLASIIVGILFGVPVLKVRGDYLAVATMGLGEIVRVLVLSDAAAPLLAGAKGILQIPRPELLGYTFNTPVSLFYIALGSALVAGYCAMRLENSRLGRAWMAIRDDEDVAQALGINLIQVKLLAYGLGAAFAGLAGAIFATMLGSIYPHSFQLLISINILALIIVGGMGSLPGVAVGALVLIGLPEMLREFGEFRYLFYGIAIIVVMRMKPEGLWPSVAKCREIKVDQDIRQTHEAELSGMRV
jgi:branched-chain amino acid transport system permease protein